MSAAPSIPNLSPEDATLFELYASLRFDLHALAQQTGLGVVKLLNWALSPPVQALMDALEFMAERAGRLAALKARSAAIHALSQLALTVQDDKERRLAASALERATKQPRAQSAGRTAQNEDRTIAPDQPFHAGAPETPTDAKPRAHPPTPVDEPSPEMNRGDPSISAASRDEPEPASPPAPRQADHPSLSCNPPARAAPDAGPRREAA